MPKQCAQSRDKSRVGQFYIVCTPTTLSTILLLLLLLIHLVLFLLAVHNSELARCRRAHLRATERTRAVRHRHTTVPARRKVLKPAPLEVPALGWLHGPRRLYVCACAVSFDVHTHCAHSARMHAPRSRRRTTGTRQRWPTPPPRQPVPPLTPCSTMAQTRRARTPRSRAGTSRPRRRRLRRRSPRAQPPPPRRPPPPPVPCSVPHRAAQRSTRTSPARLRTFAYTADASPVMRAGRAASTAPASSPPLRTHQTLTPITRAAEYAAGARAAAAAAATAARAHARTLLP
jgi:hypothetical protein